MRPSSSTVWTFRWCPPPAPVGRTIHGGGYGLKPSYRGAVPASPGAGRVSVVPPGRAAEEQLETGGFWIFFREERLHIGGQVDAVLAGTLFFEEAKRPPVPPLRAGWHGGW